VSPRILMPPCTWNCAVKWIHCTTSRAVDVQSLLGPLTIPGILYQTTRVVCSKFTTKLLNWTCSVRAVHYTTVELDV
jgi:hypothetical protein